MPSPPRPTFGSQLLLILDPYAPEATERNLRELEYRAQLPLPWQDLPPREFVGRLQVIVMFAAPGAVLSILFMLLFHSILGVNSPCAQLLTVVSLGMVFCVHCLTLKSRARVAHLTHSRLTSMTHLSVDETRRESLLLQQIAGRLRSLPLELRLERRGLWEEARVAHGAAGDPVLVESGEFLLALATLEALLDYTEEWPG